MAVPGTKMVLHLQSVYNTISESNNKAMPESEIEMTLPGPGLDFIWNEKTTDISESENINLTGLSYSVREYSMSRKKIIHDDLFVSAPPFPYAIMGIIKKQQEDKVRVLDANAFDRKLQATSEKIILDVRTLPEYQKGHLPNSILMDVKQDNFENKIMALDKSTPVFVYCAAGIRSARAADILLKNGFKEIYDLKGGIQQWEKENKQVIK